MVAIVHCRVSVASEIDDQAAGDQHAAGRRNARSVGDDGRTVARIRVGYNSGSPVDIQVNCPD